MLSACYLKINRRTTVTTRCLRFWAQTWAGTGARVFLLCDWDADDIAAWVPAELEYEAVVPSSPRMAELLHDKVAPRWRNAGAAHMTSFEHAAAEGLEEFWGIDADDTLFLHDPAMIRARLAGVEEWAHAHDVDTVSLDFYRTYENHWSFGVAFTRMSADYVGLVEALDPADMRATIAAAPAGLIGRRKAGSDVDVPRGIDPQLENIDMVFDHLRLSGEAVLESFYLDDTFFMHAGLVEWRQGEYDRTGETLRGAYHWKDGLVWDDPIDPACVKL
ncbi:MAG: hypothetical protein ACXVWW_02205 [Nocardioides sp.]